MLLHCLCKGSHNTVYVFWEPQNIHSKLVFLRVQKNLSSLWQENCSRKLELYFNSLFLGILIHCSTSLFFNLLSQQSNSIFLGGKPREVNLRKELRDALSPSRQAEPRSWRPPEKGNNRRVNGYVLREQSSCLGWDHLLLFSHPKWAALCEHVLAKITSYYTLAKWIKLWGANASTVSWMPVRVGSSIHLIFYTV